MFVVLVILMIMMFIVSEIPLSPIPENHLQWYRKVFLVGSQQRRWWDGGGDNGKRLQWFYDDGFFQEQQGGQLDLVATWLGGLLVAYQHFWPQRISRFLLVGICNKVGLLFKIFKNNLLDKYWRLKGWFKVDRVVLRFPEMGSIKVLKLHRSCNSSRSQMFSHCWPRAHLFDFSPLCVFLHFDFSPLYVDLVFSLLTTEHSCAAQSFTRIAGKFLFEKFANFDHQRQQQARLGKLKPPEIPFICNKTVKQ